MLVVLAVLVAVLVVRARPAASAGGAIDTTFGTNGATTVDFGAGSTDEVTDMSLQTDGKVVVLGDTTAGFGLVRLTASGAPDTSFGTLGAVSSAAVSDARGVAVQADGKVVVAGRSAASDGSLVVARYTTTGGLDTTFDTDGVAAVAMTGALSGGIDVGIVGGSIVTVANDAGALVLHRFTATGGLDATFGTAGRVTTALTPNQWERVGAASDGKVLLAAAGGVYRYTTAGVADGTLTISGHVPRALVVSTDGKILYAGDMGTSQPIVVRRNADGTVDGTFGIGGVSTFPVPTMTSPTARAVAVLSDGKVLVVGRESSGTNASRIYVARLTSAGALDTTFATAGIASFTAIDSQSTSSADGLAVDSTGRIVLAGTEINTTRSDDDFFVTRITGTDGTTTSSTSSTSSTSTTTTTQPGTVTAGGTGRSDPAGTQPSSTNKVVATVTTPKTGPITFAKVDAPVAAGFRTASAVTITAPAATAAEPLRLTFTVHASAFPSGLPPAAVAILRDGVDVADCTGTTVAAPDPCVLSRTRSGDVFTISALTSAASTWTMARPVVERLSGETRIASAIAASRSIFGAAAAQAVVLVRSDGFADALAATPLAAAKVAPLLLTGSSALDDTVLAEITRVLPAGRTVYLLGGTGALSDDVAARLESWGYVTERYAGDDRYATAAAVAEQGLGSPRTVIETTGLSFADALAAGAAATKTGAAVLLTAGDQQSPDTAAYLSAHRPTRFALGGPAALADPDATPVVGADRYETAVLAARRFFTAPAVLGVASGRSFPDALAGGTHAALNGAPLLLLPTTGALPVSVEIYLRELGASPPSAFLYGGTAAVDEAVATALRTALGGT